MNFKKPESEIFVPDGSSVKDAFERTTHLAVGAHQDDVEFMAQHGIIESYHSAEKYFSAVIVTNGAGSPRAGKYKDCSNEEMIQIRKKEQIKAAFLGDYSTLSQLMYSKQEVQDPNNQDLVQDLFKILMASKPKIVYSHNLADKHPVHVASALRLIQAIRQMPKGCRPKKTFGCEVWRGLDWMENDGKEKLDVSKKRHIIDSLMGLYDSQISGGKNYSQATTGRQLSNATFDESHSVDKISHMTYAMDLTPLVKDDSLDIKKFVMEYVKKFADSVSDALTTLSPSNTINNEK